MPCADVHMAPFLRHGTGAQERTTLPRISNGNLRLQAFGVTEPDAGSNMLPSKTCTSELPGGHVISGQKIGISRSSHSHMHMLIVRATPIEACRKKSDGLSLFLVDFARAVAALEATASLP